MKAMILAAGRGERLRPRTDHTPKALIEINNEPLVVHHLHQLKQAGIVDIVINLAHLGEQIERYLGNGQRFGVTIAYSKEPPGGFETGGGLANALPLLGPDPFISINADVYCPFPFDTLPDTLATHAHLVLVDNPPHNPDGDYSLQDGLLRVTKAPQPYTYSGIAVYQPRLFVGQPPGRYSVTPLIRQASQTSQISGELYRGVWFDIGTEQRLQQAQQALGVC